MAPSAINYIGAYVHNCKYYLSITDLVPVLKKISKTEIIMQSADSQYYQCFPIIASFICNYKKQVVITDIKNSMQCIICQVSSKKQENLCCQWLICTHASTQQQIQYQRADDVFGRTNDAWIYDLPNFV